MANGTSAADLRAKSADELRDLIKKTRNDLFEARFQNYTNRLDQTSKIRDLRRELARALTVATANRHAAGKTPAATPAAKAEG